MNEKMKNQYKTSFIYLEGERKIDENKSNPILTTNSPTEFVKKAYSQVFLCTKGIFIHV